MYNQPEVVMEQYDLEVKQIMKGRGAYICDTSQGMKLLKEFRGSAERAEFLAMILETLQNAGFEAEQIQKTKEGQVLVSDESGEKYILKDMVQGTECSTKSWEEMKEAVRLLAHFHQTASVYSAIVPEFMKAGKNELQELYEKHNRELIKVKNYVRSRKKKNEFEMKFQEHYPHFMENAKDIVSRLQQQKLEEQCFLLCHGDYNQHNVIKTENGWRIIHFEYMNYNAAVMDLANYLRKMLEKNNWSSGLGMELILAYQEIRPLSVTEHQELYLTLAYPEKFWKLANHYYNSHKAWLSGRNIEKLDKVITQERARLEFLQNLHSYID